jgi:secreted trypsin-like serine protease
MTCEKGKIIILFYLQFDLTDCGKSALLVSTAPRIIGGEETERGLWPWNAAIFQRQNSSSPFHFICGGTLIKPLPYSRRLVILTAAHCVTSSSGSAQEASKFQVVLGSESSLSPAEASAGVTNAQIHSVSLTLHSRLAI